MDRGAWSPWDHKKSYMTEWLMHLGLSGEKQEWAERVKPRCESSDSCKLITWGALELKWSIQVVLSWAKMAKSIYPQWMSVALWRVWRGWGSSQQLGQSLKGLIAEGPVDSMPSIQGTKLFLDRGLEWYSTVSPAHGHRILCNLPTSLVPYCLLLRHIIFSFSLSNSPFCPRTFAHALTSAWIVFSAFLTSPPTPCSDTPAHSSGLCASVASSGELSWPSTQVRMPGIHFQSLDTCQDSLLPLFLGFQVERDGPKCQVSWLDRVSEMLFMWCADFPSNWAQTFGKLCPVSLF